MKKGIKIRSHKIYLDFYRILTGVVFIMVVVGCFSFALKVAAANINGKDKEPAYIEVSIKNGDTLWDLTQKHYQGNDDIRRVIYDTKRINVLTDVNLVPGQTLKIPRY